MNDFQSQTTLTLTHGKEINLSRATVGQIDQLFATEQDTVDRDKERSTVMMMIGLPRRDFSILTGLSLTEIDQLYPDDIQKIGEELVKLNQAFFDHCQGQALALKRLMASLPEINSSEKPSSP